MKTIWFRDCKTQEEKEARRKEILGYRNSFDALREVLISQKKKPADRDYGADWHLKQIAVNEHNHVIDTVIDLITLEKE